MTLDFNTEGNLQRYWLDGETVGFRLMLRWYYVGCVGITLVALALDIWLYILVISYLTPPPRCLVGVMPCPRKSQKNYTKEKTATDKRRRRFFYTFLYLLGSTTIPWMREFFLNTLKWLNPPVKVSKIR